MNRSYWSRPVTFETTTLGVYRTISSTAEAARVLLDDWPVDEGAAWSVAQQKCLVALEGGIDHEEARQAFLKAAEEAGVFVRDS
ncbi:DUF982 domain-containing protein [Shinella fusca]|uniref:HEAT repeat protein n=1 Tax=Shinella fusca TaxID=544480 RepID=A0A7W8DTZ0_9HYPH|nr:DUF982 domain-containing protein [Shinella fusca]MBB5041915.1 HEAT repeat protein [Shinella fusca]